MEGVKLTGLWKNKTKDGKTYLSGTLGGARVMVFPNDFKRKETDPDYNVVLSPAKEKTAPAADAPRNNGEDL
jgi:hypothetical protein